jgi:hypothetical protein
MAETPGQGALGRDLELRLSVPAEGGGLRRIAGELTARVAEFLGTTGQDAQSLAARIEGLASRLGNGGGHENLTFEFRQVEGELIIEVRCSGESSEVRQRLPI